MVRETWLVATMRKWAPLMFGVVPKTDVGCPLFDNRASGARLAEDQR